MSGRYARRRPTAAARLARQIVSGWRTQAIHAAVQLQFPDLLLAKPMTPQELAAAANCDADASGRLLRALCVLGVCYERNDGRFRLSRAGRLLCADGGGEGSSLCSLVKWWGGPLWPIWANLAYSVKTGLSARQKLIGEEHYHYLDHDAALADIFHGAMSAMTALVTDDVVSWPGWQDATTVVDVGGGHGELLLAVLSTHAHLRGLVFDTATARNGALTRIAEAGMGERLCFETGDFFESLPADADCYVFKSILHNWNDERCIDILDICRRAAPRHARLLIIERIRPTRLRECVDDEGVARTDLNMLVGLSGRERSLQEYASLLDRAGFSVLATNRTAFEFTLLEVRHRG